MSARRSWVCSTIGEPAPALERGLISTVAEGGAEARSVEPVRQREATGSGGSREGACATRLAG
jgi:hypothetical protein